MTFAKKIRKFEPLRSFRVKCLCLFRSDVENLPEGDEVHFPLVRPFRKHPEQGRPLRSAAEHHQRENLHLPLVLVK
jgi:hypothetical protein